MSLKPRNKRSATYNLSSLTDVIFLLLIFFMLTSTLVAPNAIDLLLPSATGQTISKQSVTVSVTNDLEYYVGKEKVQFDNLKQKLSQKIQNKEEPTIVLNVDKRVPVDNLVKVLSVGRQLNVKMIMATKPND